MRDVGQLPSAGRRLPGIEGLRAIAALSILVLHQEPLIHWLREHGVMREGWDGFAWNLTVTLVVVGVLSYVTYRLVELPALRLKKRGRQPAASMEQAQEQAAP